MDQKCKLICKKEGCRYEQDFTLFTKQEALDWLENYIKVHHKDMRCIHECEAIDI